MTTNWTTYYSCDNIMYGLCCTPCAFANNMAKIDAVQGNPSPSCYKHCLLYSLNYMIGIVSGVMWGSVLPISAQASEAVLHCCICFNVGMYAGASRRRIREIYNLPEQPCNDFLVHICCSPCAIIQESAQIEKMTENCNQYRYIEPPETVLMK